MAIGNVTGYVELMNGQIFTSIYSLYNASFVGWFIIILFFALQSISFIKTRSLNLMWLLGMFFAALYTTTGLVITVNPVALQIIFTILILELGVIVYAWVRK